MPNKVAQPAAGGFQTAQSLFADYKLPESKGYITQEFQDFGYRLAVELNDLSHKSLYIKLAKTVERSVLERALSFTADAQALSKAKLFMWKVQQLRQVGRSLREDQIHQADKINQPSQSKNSP